MKRTPWFPASVKPVHVGVYEVSYLRDAGVIKRRRWTGQRWERLDQPHCVFGITMGDKWRGLAQPSERREG